MKARVGSGKLKMAPETRLAMEAEAKRMAGEALEEYNRMNEDEIDSMVLYILRDEFRFGEKRLRRFYHLFYHGLRELGKRHLMEAYDDRIWLAQRRLEQDGINIHKWKEEESKGENQDECAG